MQGTDPLLTFLVEALGAVVVEAAAENLNGSLDRRRVPGVVVEPKLKFSWISKSVIYTTRFRNI